MSVRIIIGDAVTELQKLSDESVHCCVTSPPYYGLRDYGTAQWDGGDPGCAHLNGALVSDKSTLAGYTSENIKLRTNGMPFRDVCGHCGARRIDAQIGLEPSPDEYVAALVAVFCEIRRVLRSDGTLWLNLGDSYASGGRATYRSGASDNKGQLVQNDMPRPVDSLGIKPKDLLGIPWLVAFALRADGWWLRQDIIWSKPNPMPESVTDRCTKAHEYLFLLSKSAIYYYDAEAISESARFAGKIVSLGEKSLSIGQSSGANVKKSGNALVDSYTVVDRRNKRSIWTVNIQPYSDAHFATFPPKLIEPCIKAGSPKGGTVLDPFGGAGTTALVADRLGRNATLIELNPAYAAMAKRRIEGDASLFAEVATEQSVATAEAPDFPPPPHAG